MRDRLKKLILENDILCHTCGETTDALCAEYLADYLIENGVIVPPCKVGDNLYVISQMKDKRILPFINTYKVTSVSIRKNGFVVYHEMDGYIKIFKQSDLGKTVFLTKAEAEKFMIDSKTGVK